MAPDQIDAVPFSKLAEACSQLRTCVPDDLMRHALKSKRGKILINGATGSGKTNTLVIFLAHAALKVTQASVVSPEATVILSAKDRTRTLEQVIEASGRLCNLPEIQPLFPSVEIIIVSAGLRSDTLSAAMEFVIPDAAARDALSRRIKYADLSSRETVNPEELVSFFSERKNKRGCTIYVLHPFDRLIQKFPGKSIHEKMDTASEFLNTMYNQMGEKELLIAVSDFTTFSDVASTDRLKGSFDVRLELNKIPEKDEEEIAEKLSIYCGRITDLDGDMLWREYAKKRLLPLSCTMTPVLKGLLSKHKYVLCQILTYDLDVLKDMLLEASRRADEEWRNLEFGRFRRMMLERGKFVREGRNVMKNLARDPVRMDGLLRIQREKAALISEYERKYYKNKKKLDIAALIAKRMAESASADMDKSVFKSKLAKKVGFGLPQAKKPKGAGFLTMLFHGARIKHEQAILEKQDEEDLQSAEMLAANTDISRRKQEIAAWLAEIRSFTAQKKNVKEGMSPKSGNLVGDFIRFMDNFEKEGKLRKIARRQVVLLGPLPKEAPKDTVLITTGRISK